MDVSYKLITHTSVTERFTATLCDTNLGLPTIAETLKFKTYVQEGLQVLQQTISSSTVKETQTQCILGFTTRKVHTTYQ